MDLWLLRGGSRSYITLDKEKSINVQKPTLAIEHGHVYWTEWSHQLCSNWQGNQRMPRHWLAGGEAWHNLLHLFTDSLVQSCGWLSMRPYVFDVKVTFIFLIRFVKLSKRHQQMGHSGCSFYIHFLTWYVFKIVHFNLLGLNFTNTHKRDTYIRECSIILSTINTLHLMR